MNLRYRLWRRRYGIDRVHGEDGSPLWWDVRTRYSVEPHDVGGRQWNWKVWLEFKSCTGSVESRLGWHGDPSKYSELRGGPSEIEGREKTQAQAMARVRAAIDDVRRRKAAGQALRNAREAAGTEEVVEL